MIKIQVWRIDYIQIPNTKCSIVLTDSTVRDVKKLCLIGLFMKPTSRTECIFQNDCSQFSVFCVGQSSLGLANKMNWVRPSILSLCISLCV